MHLQNELIVVYFAVTYCIGLIGLVLTFDNITSHADRVQAVAVAAASPLVPPALALTVMLDIVPEMALYARGVFPFLGVLGAGLWALRADHERREAEKASDKQEQRSERLAARAAKLAGNLREPSRKGNKASRESSRKGVQLEELLAFWREQPKATDGEVARHFGVERQAIWQRRQRLMRDGVIRWNGNGVEVVSAAVSDRRSAVSDQKEEV